MQSKTGGFFASQFVMIKAKFDFKITNKLFSLFLIHTFQKYMLLIFIYNM